MGATTEGEEMNSGSTEPERIKPTEETCEFEENNTSLPQDADCYTRIQDQKRADGTGILPIFQVCNMPQRPTSNALNTDKKEAEEQHMNSRNSALSASSQRSLPDTIDDTSEPLQGTMKVLHTDTPVDLEESVVRPTPAEIMELLDKKDEDWDAIYEALQKEMHLNDFDMTKQDLLNIPDVDLLDKEGYTLLYKAALKGHLEIVDDLISHGANPDKPSKGGLTPLHAAAQEGHEDIVEYLILQGADVNVECERGRTPLHIAAEKGHTNIMDSFLAEETDANKKDKKGRTPFTAAVHSGHLEAVKYLMANGAKQNRYDGKSPLYFAAKLGHYDIVEFLISKGEDLKEGHIDIVDYLILQGEDGSKKDNTEWTPFNADVQNGHLEAVKYLIAKGAKQNKFDGMTPLYISAQSGHLDMVKFLIFQGADQDEENDSGQVSLHAAASRGHLDVISFLLDHGADVNKAALSGWTPYHAAISNGHLNVVEYLTNNGAQDTRFDEMTSLYIAARAGHLDVVKFLISKGHDVNEPNGSGHTPFQGAAVRNHFQVLEYFIRHEADTAICKGWIPSHAHGRNCQPYIAECISTESTEKVKLNPEKTPFDIAVECGRLDLVTGCNSERKRVNEKNSAGELPLHAAVRSGCLEIAIFLVLLGADVNKTDDRGTAPLHVAIQNGHVEVVKYLKTKGAQDTRVHGMTQLYVAAQSGHLDMVKFLISQGAEVNEENDSGQFPLHGAASRGHLEVIKFLLSQGSEVNKVTNSGWTPVHAAISNGHLNVVEYLADHGDHDTRYHGMTPLYIAARAGYLDVIKFLISKGHDANELNSSGFAPIHGAAMKDHSEVMKYLIRQGADIRTGEAAYGGFHDTAYSNSPPETVEYIYTERPQNKGKTPLYLAVECGQLDLVYNWIKKGAHVNGTNSNGEVALHAAARKGNLDITKYLICLGANMEKKDDAGTTPFLVAIHSGHVEVVKYLKRKGAQYSRVHGMTPLYIAAQSGHLDIVDFLISQGADVNEENVSGQVPLHGAASGGHLEVVKYLVNHEAHVNKETVTGSTPFFRAVSNGHLEVVKYLRTKGACMKICQGMTPLYIAAQNGHSEVVKFIIKEGVDVNDGSISGRTPLHAASFTGNLDVVSSLVNARANVNAKDGDDWTPLHAAAQEGHTNVVTYLINNGADINVKDAEGFSPHLSIFIPGCQRSLEYQTSYGDEPFDKVSQKAVISGSCQDQGESAKSLEAPACEIIKGEEEHFLGSGVKALLPTAVHRDDIAKHLQDSSSSVDPVERRNRFAPSKSAEEEPNTITINYETPADAKERKEGETSPFTHAKPKCPVNKSHTYLSPETENSSHKQLDTKYAGTALQHGSFKWKLNHVKAPFLHLTEKTAHQEVTQSGCGIRREDNREMKVPSSIKFRGNTEQSLEDDPTENTSASKTGTEPLRDQISPEDCTPTIDARDSKNKRRKPDKGFPPSLVLLRIFIRMVVVVAIIQTGRPVLAGGSLRSEQVTLQAGKAGMVPFYIPRPSGNTSQITAHYLLQFESKQLPFCINGNRDIEGFKSPSQMTRFEIIMTEMTTFYSINLNVDSVDTLDQDIYILTVVFHGLENVLGETLRKEVLVNIPPGTAQCFITLSESSNYPYEVHCQATTGSMQTTLTCYQDSQRVEVKGDITDNGQVIRGVFLLHDHSPFSCCSHDVTSEVNVTMCNDFEWPPSNNHISPSTVNDHTLTQSAANTIAAIGNTDEQVSKTLAESQVDSGTIKHYMVSSVYHLLTLGLMIYLFFC